MNTAFQTIASIFQENNIDYYNISIDKGFDLFPEIKNFLLPSYDKRFEKENSGECINEIHRLCGLWNKYKKLSNINWIQLNQIFNEIKPSFLLCWGTTSPPSRYLLNLAIENCIPYLIIERGHIPNTLIASTNGQASNAFCKPNIHKYSSSDRIKNKLFFEEFKNKLKINKDFHNTNKNKKTILFLGCFDLGAGIGFEKLNLGENYYYGFKSTLECLEYLLRSLKDSNRYELIIRPHPYDKNNYEPLIKNEEYIYIDRSSCLNDLVYKSDIVIGPGSTTNFLAILYSKPLITFGTSEFDKFDIVQNIGKNHSEIIKTINFCSDSNYYQDEYLTKTCNAAKSVITEELFHFDDYHQFNHFNINDLANWISNKCIND